MFLCHNQSGRLLFGGYHNNDVLVWDTLRPGDKPTALIGALGDASITVAEAKKRQPRVNLRSSSTVLPALEAGSVLPTPSTATRDTHRRHVDRVSCLALAPNGTALASGSWDSTVLVRFWCGWNASRMLAWTVALFCRFGLSWVVVDVNLEFPVKTA